MEQLQVIVHDNRRVLTTAQLAESYGTNSDRISKNFSENKARYKEGKHFIKLEGEQLLHFRKSEPQLQVSNMARVLYLWTEKGAWHHAKSLGTDEAWDAYEKLVDEYYSIVEKLSAEQQLRKHLELSIMTSQRVDEIEEKVTHLTNTMRIDSYQEKTLFDLGRAQVMKAIGGKESAAYNDRSFRTRIFKSMWNEFNNYFKVTTYKAIPRVSYEKGIELLKLWEPSASMKLEIQQLNGQGSLF